MRSRLRFIVAISLAVVLGGWLAYTSLGGALETYAGPTELEAGTTYRLNGLVAAGAPADAAVRAESAEGVRFTVVDKNDASRRVQVLYRGSVPDQFKDGRELVVTGSMQRGTFVAQRDTMVTLCPSKFSDEPTEHTTGVPPA